MKNYYKILGVSENASEIQIKEAYDKLIKKYQPDNFSGEAKKLVIDRIEDVKEAYSVLSDDFLRSQFDKEAGIETRIDLEVPVRKKNKSKSESERNYYQPNKYREEFYNQEDIQVEDDYNNSKKVKVKDKPKVGSTADLAEITKAVFSRLKQIQFEKPTKKGVLSMLAAIGIVLLLGLILWLIPFTRGFIESLFVF